MQPDLQWGELPSFAPARVLLIAEIGINHDGNFEKACRLIDAAADSGADAVKFQTFHADRLMIASSGRLEHQEAGYEPAFEMFRRLELSQEDYRKLKDHADRRGILFLSTPFDEESVDFLDGLGVPAFKVASADLTYKPLLRHIARKRKPVFLSTGMSYLDEVAEAVTILREFGSPGIVLLHCVSLYPAPPESLNLRALRTLQDRFALPVGFSDHSQGNLYSLVAAALGACVLERHFTLDRNSPGPDHKASLDPEGFRSLVDGLQLLSRSLGDGTKRPAAGEESGRRSSRRSIVAAVDIRAHETIHPRMLAFKRPGSGLDPRVADRLIGRQASRDLAQDSILQWEDFLPAPILDAEDGFRELTI